MGSLRASRLLVLAVALALGIYFWESPALWPLKLLVVMMHESGHALGAWLVGGSVDRVILAANESGACLSRVPGGFWARVVVFSAGYVGSAVAGAGLLVATFRFRVYRPVLVAACAWLAAMALFFSGDLFTRLFCLGTALTLALCARFLPEVAVKALNLFLAAFSALYVIWDLRSDLWDGRARAFSDAALLAKGTLVSSLVWAGVWTLCAVALLGVAVLHAVGTGPSRSR